MPEGLEWAWQIDVPELLAAVSWSERGAAGGPPEQDADQEAVLDAEAEAAAVGRVREVPPAEVAGRVAARLPAGPGLAALLGAVPATDLADYGLPDAAAGFRRLASWAQARELACVAQIAARSAARDQRIGTAEDGRPAQVSREACAQVSLALMATGVGARWWTDLAVTLSWRLAATGAALAAGNIDLARARLIADMTGALGEEAARSVEAQILPGAADKTTGTLRAALRRAVIAADPEGAERRRDEAERHARVVLHPEADSTATLAGQGLPGVHAAAAMARVKAMARALKASGAVGRMDFLTAQVFLGILMGTLPPIPPPAGGSPDNPPSGAGDPPGGASPAEDEPAAGEPAGDQPSAGDEIPWPDAPADENDDPGPEDPGPEDPGPEDAARARALWRREDEDWPDAGCRARAWPPLPAGLPAGLAPAGPTLDLSVPWMTLAGISFEPGSLTRLGPVTPIQARHLADLAGADSATQWRVIVTDSSGRARAVARIPRRDQAAPGQRNGPGQPERSPPGTGLRDGLGSDPARAGPPLTGLVSRVTLIVPADLISAPPDGITERGGVLAAALRAAGRAAATADTAEAADAAVGGCAHGGQSASYRPPPVLRDLVAARDLTCRFPTCRRPAWRGDLDHTIAWEHGGRTCRCNLGGVRLRLCTMRMETGRLGAGGKALVVRAAIYVRISSDRAGAGMGVARQEEDCRALCERLGWQVASVYRDNDVSAFSGQTRPAWQQLNSDIAAG